MNFLFILILLIDLFAFFLLKMFTDYKNCFLFTVVIPISRSAKCFNIFLSNFCLSLCVCCFFLFMNCGCDFICIQLYTYINNLIYYMGEICDLATGVSHQPEFEGKKHETYGVSGTNVIEIYVSRNILHAYSSLSFFLQFPSLFHILIHDHTYLCTMHYIITVMTQLVLLYSMPLIW